MNQIENIMALADEYALSTESYGFKESRTAKQSIALRTAIEQALAVQPKQEPVNLETIEQYRMQMAGISTAAFGYWKEGDGIHPDYDTVALRDVAKLYAKYDEFYKQVHAPQPQPKQEPVAKAWDEGYRAGINDERMSEANIGIAGFDAKVEPARNNPYRNAPQPQPEKRPPNCGTGFCSCIECPYPNHFPDAGKMIEPFGYFRSTLEGWEDCSPDDEGARPLYEAPQPAKREPLTTQEIDAVMRKALGYGLSPSRDDLDFARAIEAAHGITGGAK